MSTATPTTPREGSGRRAGRPIRLLDLDVPDIVFASGVAPVTGRLEQRPLRQRHTDMVPDRLGDSFKVSGMCERPYLRLVPEPVSRPDLRRVRRRDVVVYRVRAHLDDSDPTIWRRLDLRSNQTRLVAYVFQIVKIAHACLSSEASLPVARATRMGSYGSITSRQPESAAESSNSRTFTQAGCTARTG